MSHLEEIVKVVIYKSREIGNPVTETLAAFIAQTVLKPKTNKFFSEEKIDEKDIEAIIDLTLQKLSNLNTPSMKTIQMQIQYETKYLDFEYRKQERLKIQSQETGKLIDEIVTLDTRNGKDFESLAHLYKKIFNYLLYKNKELVSNQQGYSAPYLNPQTVQNISIEKEVAAALESVIPRAALAPFISLSNSEKVTQLAELSNLVVGIRLFNKEIKKGGASLTGIEELIEYEGRRLLEVIQEVIRDTVTSSEDYTTFLTYYQKLDTPFTKDQINKFKDELTFLRQYLSYLVSLQDDLETAEGSIESSFMKYSKEIEELKNLLGNKSSAPKEQVYPKFATVSQAYIQMLEERNTNNMRMDLFKLLQILKTEFHLTLDPAYIEEAKRVADQDEDEMRPEDIPMDPNSEVIRLLPSTTPDFMQTPLDFLGYCVWSIKRKDGLLVPGKPSLGVYRYKDKYCVFSSIQAIQDFLQAPGQYLDGVAEQCRKNPELIHLLRLEDNFKHVTIYSLIQSRDGGPSLSTKLMVDKGCDTPTHFVEKNIDPNYCWNEWDLRRKAIQMANIRNKQTMACQTILSNFKVDSEAQVWPKKDQSTNTGISTGTDPIKPKNYIVGLRTKKTN